MEYFRFEENFRTFPDLIPGVGFFTFELRRNDRALAEDRTYLEHLKTGFYIAFFANYHAITASTLAVGICKGLETMLK